MKCSQSVREVLGRGNAVRQMGRRRWMEEEYKSFPIHREAWKRAPIGVMVNSITQPLKE